MEIRTESARVGALVLCCGRGTAVCGASLGGSALACSFIGARIGSIEA